MSHSNSTLAAPVALKSAPASAKSPGAAASTAPAKGPGRPRHDRASGQDVAERLLDAATALAAEQSFESCGLREIAARADVSSGMISYYFGDRQGLYQAMFQRALDRVNGEVEGLLKAQGGSTGDRLDSLLELHVRAIASDPWLPKLIVRELISSPDAALKQVLTDRVGSGPMPMMISWIEEQQSRGLLRNDLDARLLTVTLVSLTVFPFLMLPIVGAELGIELDASFPGRLIEHNQRLLGRGLASRVEES